MGALGASPPADKLASAWQALLTFYRTPADPLVGSPRSYHNLAHIADCLAEVPAFDLLQPGWALVVLALAYHDCIYDVNRPDNEGASAVAARAALLGLGVSAAICERIEALIVATDHRTENRDPLAAVVCDIDLGSMSGPLPVFRIHSAAIRREYAAIADRVFYPARLEIIERFLARPHLYATALYREKREKQARTNLEAHIADLKAAIAALG